MRSSQPASVSSGDPQLPSCTELPGELRRLYQVGLVPHQHVVGLHDVEVLVVDAGAHHVVCPHLAREECHALVLGILPGQGMDREIARVADLEHLRKDVKAVEGRIGPVVDGGPIFLDEPHEAHVLYSSALVFRMREDHGSGHIDVLRMSILVVGSRQGDHVLLGLLHGHGVLLGFSNVLDGITELLKGKLALEPLKHGVGQRVLPLHFPELEAKGLLEVGPVFLDLELPVVRAALLHDDVVLPVDHAPPEDDGGDVALSRGAQAHEEAQAPFRKTALVKRRHHGGVEERRRLYGVLHGEIGPDEASPLLGEILVIGIVFLNVVIMI